MENITEEVLIDKEEIPLYKYSDTGCWHSGGVVPLKQYNLIVRGMITGCGLGQMTGVTYLSIEANQSITKEEFLSKLSPFRSNGMGAILCTLGKDHYRHEKRLIEVGFEFLSEYHNYRHNSNYMQRVYIIKL